ncbi:hypothetical protein K7432_014929 [Basidiobolus ranarum]|uniref:Uncharacterized protein n=1 Tax=Basidiobolus ranarum TaxID=34480 RepID=A0ABR2WGS3_9FUNG
MLGILSLKNSFVSGMTLIPLLGCTIYFIYHCRSTYRDHTKYVPLDALYEREEAIEKMHSCTYQASSPDNSQPVKSSTSEGDGKQKGVTSTSLPSVSKSISPPVPTDENTVVASKESRFKATDSSIPGISLPKRRKHHPGPLTECSVAGTYPSLSDGSFSYKHFEYDPKSPVKQKLIKIQHQIFSTPLLSLLWQPTDAHEKLIDKHIDPKEVLATAVLPNREICQDDTNPFETYLHPDLIRPLPRFLWLPQNPFRHLYALDSEMRDLDMAITSSTFVPSTLGGDSSLGFGDRAMATTRRNRPSREAHTANRLPFLFNSVRSMASKSLAPQSSFEVSKFQTDPSEVSGSTASARSRPASGLMDLIRSFTSKVTLEEENMGGSRSISMAEFPDQYNDGPLSEYGSRVDEEYSPRSSISSGRSE